MSEVFDALGHPTRRRILDLLRASPGMLVGEVAEHFDVGRIAVMHLSLIHISEPTRPY